MFHKGPEKKVMLRKQAPLLPQQFYWSFSDMIQNEQMAEKPYFKYFNCFGLSAKNMFFFFLSTKEMVSIF